MSDFASRGVELINAERWRQAEVEGYTAEHDDVHENGELAAAGACYARFTAEWLDGVETNPDSPPEGWPWAPTYWKPDPDDVRTLVKAGALIAAQIDAILRQQEPLDG